MSLLKKYNIVTENFCKMGISFQQANVPMSTAQIDRLVEMLDKDGDGEIDYQ